jgi:Cupin domain
VIDQASERFLKGRRSISCIQAERCGLPSRRLLGASPHPASGFVFAYVLSGTIRSQVEGEPLRIYSAGQSWTEPPGAHHLVSANASKSKPARLIAYIIADEGVQPTVYDK